jgi:hypothetical protein
MISILPLQRQYSLDKIRQGTSSLFFHSLSLLEQLNFKEQCSLWIKYEDKTDMHKSGHNLPSDY